MTAAQIAIDGPAGAGKSTVAKLVADRLGYLYIDTGAMYRAVGYEALRQGWSTRDVEAEPALLDGMEIDFQDGGVLLNGEALGYRIRTPEVAKAASDFSALAPVRAKLVELQRGIGRRKSVVMDGRDIGSNVLTDAEFKFYLTASVEERARRRCLELRQKGIEADPAQVQADIAARDYNDSHRKLNPLCRAEDAVEIDSSAMEIPEVLDCMLALIRGKDTAAAAGTAPCAREKIEQK